MLEKKQLPNANAPCFRGFDHSLMWYYTPLVMLCNIASSISVSY
jgi:hypothetical protein